MCDITQLSLLCGSYDGLARNSKGINMEAIYETRWALIVAICCVAVGLASLVGLMWF
jgi:hypothetical protein